jgi:hypothetical protein
MIPFELDLYVSMLEQDIEEERQKREREING